jgi:hypothetical protein
MKTRRALLKGGVLAAAAAMAGGALWMNETTAQVDAATSAVQLDAALLAPSAVMRAWNSTPVPVSGVVTGSPESVTFSGTATVGTRLAPDPDFGSPSLVVSIDLTGITGVGASTRTKYAIGGPEIVQRRLAPSYTVDLTFPFYKSGTNGTTDARSGAATFSFTVNPGTGAISSPQGIIVSSNL